MDARQLPEIASPTYPDFQGDAVNLLWVVPLKEKEYDWLCKLPGGSQAALEQLKIPLEKLVIFDGEGKLQH